MAPDDPTAPSRKADHLRIAAEPGSSMPAARGWPSCACATARCPSATSTT